MVGLNGKTGEPSSFDERTRRCPRNGDRPCCQPDALHPATVTICHGKALAVSFAQVVSPDTGLIETIFRRCGGRRQALADRHIRIPAYVVVAASRLCHADFR